MQFRSLLSGHERHSQLARSHRCEAHSVPTFNAFCGFDRSFAFKLSKLTLNPQSPSDPRKAARLDRVKVL
jgi:hypothetical protein